MAFELSHTLAVLWVSRVLLSLTLKPSSPPPGWPSLDFVVLGVSVSDSVTVGFSGIAQYGPGLEQAPRRVYFLMSGWKGTKGVQYSRQVIPKGSLVAEPQCPQ